jgi:hypothetical protein
VEISAVANIPPTQTCMNCHKKIRPIGEKLRLVRESFESGEPIEWIRVHNLPDYVYFDHSAHLNSGVGCSSCHGRIDQMNVVIQEEPLSMSWCLDCHRNPVKHIRNRDEITEMSWKPTKKQTEYVENLIKNKKISPPTDCWGCHR